MSSSAPPYRAAVIGLGQVGSRFDEEPGRTAVWSHVGAYLKLPDRFQLGGCVEISPANIAAFAKRCPDIPVFADVKTLIREVRPQIASICTPVGAHSDILNELLTCQDLRLIWCEKPLAGNLEDAHHMVAACRDRSMALMVSYNRHWSPFWRRVRDMLLTDVIGPIRSVRVLFPNRVLAIGSHAVDLAVMLGGPVEDLRALSLPALKEEGEEAVSAVLRFRSGAGGTIQVAGFKSQLMVEAEIIGDGGRLYAREDRQEIALEHFKPSGRYSGYSELGEAVREDVEVPKTFSAFVAMAENAAGWLGKGEPLLCDGAHALEVQRVLHTVISAAGND